MMPPPGLQIYLRPCVTLTFDLLIPKVDRFMPLPGTSYANWHRNSFVLFVFASLVTIEQTTKEEKG